MTDRSPWVFWVMAGTALATITLVGLQRAVYWLTLGIELVFVAFFVRHLLLAVSAIYNARAQSRAPGIDNRYRPRVSVLVACKDEAAVAEGLVRSLLALDYPPDRLELVLVDDGSSDGTGSILRSLAEVSGGRVVVVERSASGGKPAALNDGLDAATGEILVIFDADHRPHRDVLTRLVHHFADPSVGAVQGRCVIRNADESPIARLVAVDYLAGYLINEYGRQSVFRLPAYGGANCAVRRADLEALGGWNPNSVTEDTDLTLRLVLAGRRVRYEVKAVDEEQAVVSLRRYWRQRYRWARGHQKVWRDYRRAVWSSPRLSRAEKVETTMFLLTFHVPVVSALGLVVLLLWLAGLVQPEQPIDVSALWTLLFLGPLLELGGALLVARCSRRDAFALIWFLPIFLVSIALCTKAWLDGLAGRPYTWVKTKRSPDLQPQVAGS